jgi:hypothetical protein
MNKREAMMKFRMKRIGFDEKVRVAGRILLIISDSNNDR